MSGDMADVTLKPVVDALVASITASDIVNLFATGVTVALPLLLVWFGCRWVYRRFTNAVQGGRG